MRRYLPIVLLGLSSCVKTLPPPAAPAKEFPVMSGAVPRLSPGVGRVYFDVAEGPASVLPADAQSFTQAICITPCFVDLPYGQHAMKFVLRENSAYSKTAVINFTEEVTAERYALELKFKPSPRWLVLGAGAVIAGIVTLSAAGTAREAQQDINFAKDDPFFQDDPTFFEDQIQIFSKKRNKAIVVSLISLPITVGLGYVFAKSTPPKREGALTRWPVSETPSLAEYDQRSLEDEKAAALYADAKARYNTQDYEGALRIFQEAYVLSKKAELLINIGQCYRQMGKNEEAKKSFRAFLNEAPGSEFAPEIEALLKGL